MRAVLVGEAADTDLWLWSWLGGGIKWSRYSTFTRSVSTVTFLVNQKLQYVASDCIRRSSLPQMTCIDITVFADCLQSFLFFSSLARLSWRPHKIKIKNIFMCALHVLHFWFASVKITVISRHWVRLKVRFDTWWLLTPPSLGILDSRDLKNWAHHDGNSMRWLWWSDSW